MAERHFLSRVRRLLSCLGLLALVALPYLPRNLRAAELAILVDNPPARGTITVLLFDSAGTFGDLRDPVKVHTYQLEGANSCRIVDVPPGDYAFVLYLDENANGRLDENFIGIPREPVGFSNGYRPKGRPSYARARFSLKENETRECAVELRRPLGKRGRVGLGLGLVARSSPYRGSDQGVFQAIPAITYIGERVQVLGPAVHVGLFNLGSMDLAGVARYHMGSFDEDDSPVLEGLGHRRDTLMAGIALAYDLPHGLGVSARYEHDVLGRIGGGTGGLTLRRSFRRGAMALTPGVGMNWLSQEMANQDFGVPVENATSSRPAYRLGTGLTTETGASFSLELPRDWVLMTQLGVEFLDRDMTRSPIVGKDYVVKGFAAISYLL